MRLVSHSQTTLSDSVYLTKCWAFSLKMKSIQNSNNFTHAWHIWTRFWFALFLLCSSWQATFYGCANIGCVGLAWPDNMLRVQTCYLLSRNCRLHPLFHQKWMFVLSNHNHVPFPSWRRSIITVWLTALLHIQMNQMCKNIGNHFKSESNRGSPSSSVLFFTNPWEKLHGFLAFTRIVSWKQLPAAAENKTLLRAVFVGWKTKTISLKRLKHSSRRGEMQRWWKVFVGSSLREAAEHCTLSLDPFLINAAFTKYFLT